MQDFYLIQNIFTLQYFHLSKDCEYFLHCGATAIRKRKDVNKYCFVMLVTRPSHIH